MGNVGIQQLVGQTSEAIWYETVANKLAGLLEETVEVIHASKEIDKDTLKWLFRNIVDHVYDGAVGSVADELVDLQYMLLSVRHSLVDDGSDVIDKVDDLNTLLYNTDINQLRQKMDIKIFKGMRLG
jgi:NTP pyrophosphatase (non-canonical NTP hydrolase)